MIIFMLKLISYNIIRRHYNYNILLNTSEIKIKDIISEQRKEKMLDQLLPTINSINSFEYYQEMSIIQGGYSSS